MELFFNLAWSVLSLFLAFLWIKDLRKSRKDRSRPRPAYQLVALVMLIVILLPVVSLTDDLHAMPGFVESEHVARRGYIFSGNDQPADIAALLYAKFFVNRFLPQPSTHAAPNQPSQIVRPRAGFIRDAANKPPPALV